MNMTLTAREGIPRVSNGRAGNAIALDAACAEAHVPIEVGVRAVKTMRVFALPGLGGGWLVSPASVAVLIELGRRQRLPGVMEVIA